MKCFNRGSPGSINGMLVSDSGWKCRDTAIELPVRPPLEVRAGDRVGVTTSDDADERADAGAGNGHVGLVVRK